MVILEMYDIFYIGEKDSQFISLKESFITLKHVDTFESAQKKCVTKFFWCVWDHVTVDYDFSYEPDDWSQDIVHIFKNGKYDDGIWLVPKQFVASKSEIDYRFVVRKKAVDIVASEPKEFPTYVIDSYDEYLNALNTCDTEMFWMSSRNIRMYKQENFYFEYQDRYNRTENHAFQHLVQGECHRNGLFLMSKNKPVTQREIEYRHLVSRKEWARIGSGSIPYDIFYIETYEEYLQAMEESTTELFYASTPNVDIHYDFHFDIYFTHDDEYNRKENHVFIHRVNEQDYYNGIMLLSKHKPVTKREIEYRHLVSRKEWDIVASKKTTYEVFNINSWEEYEYALANSRTELFYSVPKDVIVTGDFDLYFTHDDEFNRKENHTLQNMCNGVGKENGIFLLSKHKPVSKKELEHKHLVYKKSWDKVISKHKPYNVVFMSYDEENADNNYAKLLERCPNAKRVHGVKGIHQAHIAAALKCESEMIWIIDADAELVEDFDFDLYVEKWDRETVHVWRSKNPINNLVYGYGGVKLFPRQLTIDMDVSKPDMTTSITHRFKAVPSISNITAFNVDEFSTWKSAFRECCKLASKVIDRQKVEETNQRLHIWTTVGEDKPFGEWAIAGAKAGKQYGENNKDNVEALKQINDFSWLREYYEKY
jgi:hypothetical protein